MRKRLLLFAAALCLMLTLAGCGQSYPGVWRCAYVDTSYAVMTAGDLDNAGSELYLDLRSGGSGYMTADGETQRITWKRSGDKTALLLTVNGEIEEFRLEDDGNALVWSMDDVTVTFLKENSEAYEQALATLSYQALE
ncbi:MAG: DUF3048 C-terminal domain-containing protein [Oscillospiraceae bacterium]